MFTEDGVDAWMVNELVYMFSNVHIHLHIHTLAATILGAAGLLGEVNIHT